METRNPHRTTQQLPRGTIMNCVCFSVYGVWLLDVSHENQTDSLNVIEG